MKNCDLIYFILCYLAALVFCPLLPGVINKVKAFFAGRRGVRILQLYYDIFKLLKKERIHSTTSNWILAAAPLAGVAFTITALLFLPLGLISAPLGFAGDAILFFYLLATARFATVLAALDTGSSFEGMGASREVQFSALAEGTVFVMLAMLAMQSGSLETSFMLQGYGIHLDSWISAAGTLLTAVAFFVILLCENCRVPFDDPETHLELTMIHEAMVLDYAGPDLAAIFYGAALKLWVFSSFLVALIVPGEYFCGAEGVIIYFAGILLTAISIGIVESVMARSRFLKLPQLLTGATVVVALAAVLQIFFQGGAK